MDNQFFELPSCVKSLTRLRRLNVENNSIQTIPEWTGELRLMEELSFSKNKISNFPSTVGSLKYLTDLRVAHNQMTQVPTELGQALSLSRLRLSGNMFTDLPDSITDLTNLTDLSVADNNLQRLPPGLGTMTQLQNLIMENNPSLFSYIPPDILNKGVESTRGFLRALALAKETLQLTLMDLQISVLSPSITELTAITSLRLDRNSIVELPDHLFGMTNLTSLSLKTNKIDYIPVGLLKLTSLTYLNFDENPFKSFPIEIIREGKDLLYEYLARVETSYRTDHLDLSNLGLNAMPQEVPKLSGLTGLSLANNRITSVQDIQKLKHLVSLDLSHNQISSLIADFGTLTEMRKLNLQSNKLTFLPLSMANMVNLQALDLDHNPFESPPSEIIAKGKDAVIDYLRSLSFGAHSDSVDLRNQGLEKIPAYVLQFHTLQTLLLDQNSLSALPSDINVLANLKTLTFTDNKIRELPDAIGLLENLTELRCDKNSLEVIPQTIGNLARLECFSLRSNKLRVLPPEVGGLIRLSEFDIRDNEELHLLPIELGKITTFKIFWFDADSITFPQKEIISEGPKYTMKFLRLLYDATKSGNLDLSSPDYSLKVIEFQLVSLLLTFLFSGSGNSGRKIFKSYTPKSFKEFFPCHSRVHLLFHRNSRTFSRRKQD